MTVELRAGSASLVVAPDDGGRWTSLVVDGLELLSGADVDGVPAGTRTGCFAMAPFAGRLGLGRLDFAGRTTQLPVDAPPHAIHGQVYAAAWQVERADASSAELAVRLTAPWPFAGLVRQSLALHAHGLDARLSLHAQDRMPVTLGYHPWFARRLARGRDLELDLQPLRQYARDDTGLPTGELVEPTGGPWDDCFLGMARPPALRWPGALRLELASSAEHWVVFTERPDVACVEPQTGPPDAVRLDAADVLPAGGELSLSFGLRWVSERP